MAVWISVNSPFMCTVVRHVPMMHGQLVVLSPAVMTGRARPGE